MLKNISLNIVTLLSVLFLYTGFYLQQDISGSLSRTYNSVVGLMLVLTMLFFMFYKRNVKSVRKTIVKPFVITWIIILIMQTLITSDSLQRAFITFYYVTVWPISYLFFFKISKNSLYNEVTISNRFLVLIAAAVLLFSVTGYATYLLFGFNGSIGNSYYLLCLFPWSLIIPDKKIKFLTIIVLTLFILVSMKRAPILALAVVSMVYSVTSNPKQSILSKLLSLIFVISAGVALFYYLDMFLLDGHMMERFDNLERGSDTRGEIRETVIEMYNQSSFQKQLLGHGYNSVVSTNPLDLSAHNDYIETLYDHGLFVLLLQLTIIFRLFYLSLKLYIIKSSYFAPLLSSVLLYVIVAYATHMVLYPYYFLFISGFWGYIEGMYVAKRD